MPTLLATMDALFIGLKRSPLFRFGISPNKLMDYMAAAKPVIHAIEAGNDMVAESGCGLSVAAGGSRGAGAAIRRLMTIPRDERLAMGARGREYVWRGTTIACWRGQFLDVWVVGKDRSTMKSAAQRPAVWQLGNRRLATWLRSYVGRNRERGQGVV